MNQLDAWEEIAAELRHGELFSEDIAAELHAGALFEELYDAGCRLLANGLPVLPINGKLPCNRSGNPMRAWQRVKCDDKRLRRGLLGARDPKPYWKNKKRVRASEPGIGLRMGPGSVIDIETDSEEEVVAVKHLFMGVRIPKTVAFASLRGKHYLFRYDTRLAPLGKVFRYRAPDGNSVSIRIGGHESSAQSVIPPSPGRKWLPGCSFEETEPAALPDAVIERLLEQAPPLADDSEDEVQSNSSASDAALSSSGAVLATWPLALSSLRTPYYNLDSSPVEQAINGAVIASVPTQYRKRHECIFNLVRRLKAIPELQGIRLVWLETPQGQEWLHGILSEWYARGSRFIRGDYEECLDDFLRDWDKVRQPWGHKLEAAYQESFNEHLPAEVIKRLGVFDNENTRSLLKLMAVLQRRAGDEPFLIVQEAFGTVLGIRQQAVSTKLKYLETLGLVQNTRKGKRGQGSEYRYLGQHVENAEAALRSPCAKPSDSEAA